MLFRFLILSDEADDFKREIKIDSESTFLDLQNAILDSVGYTKDQMTSFFICDDDWSKKTEITLVEMDTSSEEDSYVMADTQLEELLEDEHQKLLFVFDYMTERAFFMELREIVPGKDLDAPICSKSVGTPPAQIVSFDEFEAKKHDVAANAILDACTGSNPRQPSQEEMEQLLECVYTDTPVTF